MTAYRARNLSDGSSDPFAISEAINGVLKANGLLLGGILFERDGRVARVGAGDFKWPGPLRELGDRLVFRGRHPALDASKSRRTPFDVLALDDAYQKDAPFRDFVDEARSHDIKSIYAFPFYGLSGRLLVASGVRFGRAMLELELRLTHSFCLDALDGIDETEGSGPPEKLLTPRERQCLIAAGRGDTEKDTARRLGISPNTVHAHLESGKQKLGVKSKIKAVICANRRGEFGVEDL